MVCPVKCYVCQATILVESAHVLEFPKGVPNLSSTQQAVRFVVHRMILH